MTGTHDEPHVCRGNNLSLGAYFLEGRRAAEPCKRSAAFRVRVNPPRADSDGTVLLCDLHNRLDYLDFPRIPMEKIES